MSDPIQSHLAEFGARSGLGPLALNPQGVCRLVFDGDLTVDIEHRSGEGSAHLAATVGAVSAEPDAGLMLTLLDANLMGSKTGGASLAIDVLRGEIVLCRSLPVDGLSYQAFEMSLEAFVGALEHWTDEVVKLDVPASPAASPVIASDEVAVFRL